MKTLKTLEILKNETQEEMLSHHCFSSYEDAVFLNHLVSFASPEKAGVNPAMTECAKEVIRRVIGEEACEVSVTETGDGYAIINGRYCFLFWDTEDFDYFCENIFDSFINAGRFYELTSITKYNSEQALSERGLFEICKKYRTDDECFRLFTDRLRYILEYRERVVATPIEQWKPDDYYHFAIYLCENGLFSFKKNLYFFGVVSPGETFYSWDDVFPPDDKETASITWKMSPSREELELSCGKTDIPCKVFLTSIGNRFFCLAEGCSARRPIAYFFIEFADEEEDECKRHIMDKAEELIKTKYSREIYFNAENFAEKFAEAEEMFDNLVKEVTSDEFKSLVGG